MHHALVFDCVFAENDLAEVVGLLEDSKDGSDAPRPESALIEIENPFCQLAPAVLKEPLLLLC